MISSTAVRQMANRANIDMHNGKAERSANGIRDALYSVRLIERSSPDKYMRNAVMSLAYAARKWIVLHCIRWYCNALKLVNRWTQWHTLVFFWNALLAIWCHHVAILTQNLDDSLTVRCPFPEPQSSVSLTPRGWTIYKLKSYLSCDSVNNGSSLSSEGCSNISLSSRMNTCRRYHTSSGSTYPKTVILSFQVSA